MTDTKLEKKTLKEWREEAGLQQGEVGELAGCSHATVSAVELGNISLDAKAARRILEVLELDKSEVLQENELEDFYGFANWADDGYSPDAPRRPLKWWRQRRNLSLSDLHHLAGVARSTIQRLEAPGSTYPTRPLTKRNLCKALRLEPDKLLLPGEGVPEESRILLDDGLRAELRGARRALKKAYDFIREDPNVSLRALDKRDAILPDIERELRGL